MTFVGIVEVQPVFYLLDRDGIFMGIVLEDQLFQKQERSLVRNLLPYLKHSLPCVLCRKFGAVGALSVLNEILHLEHLFNDGVCEDL